MTQADLWTTSAHFEYYNATTKASYSTKGTCGGVDVVCHTQFVYISRGLRTKNKKQDEPAHYQCPTFLQHADSTCDSCVQLHPVDHISASACANNNQVVSMPIAFLVVWSGLDHTTMPFSYQKAAVARSSPPHGMLDHAYWNVVHAVDDSPPSDCGVGLATPQP